MLAGITVLLLFQLAGEVLAKFFALPVPGPVIGMALLFIALTLRRQVPAALRESAATLLQHLALLFVPAGVGVVLHSQRIVDEWLPISAALLVSTLLALASTALLLHYLLARQERAK